MLWYYKQPYWLKQEQWYQYNISFENVTWCYVFTTLIVSQVIYFQVSHFSFPFATIIHECAVDNKGLYFTTHEVIRKNLKRNGQETIREDAKKINGQFQKIIIHTYTTDGF